MKKSVLFVVMCLAISTKGLAQWNFGVKAGVNYSTQHSPVSSVFDGSHRWGPQVGVMTSYTLSSSFELQGELLYARRGFKTDVYVDMDDSKAHDWNFSFHYLNLPVLAKYHPFDKIAYIEAGPQLGYLIDSGNKVKGVDLGDEAALKPKYNKIDFGFVGGIGADLGDHFNVDVRYYYGLTHTQKDYDKGENRSWELSVGYWF